MEATVTLTALDVHFLLPELQAFVGGRINKIYATEDAFSFECFKTGIGKRFLTFTLPSLITITEEKQANEEPSNFCMTLRKHLTNKRITSLEQQDFERLIVMKCEDTVVVFELFDKGNLVLLKEDTTIIAALTYRKRAERTIRGGIPYLFPTQKANPLTLTLPAFSDLLKDNKEIIVKFLARAFSLGGKYAEELCQRANIDKSEIKIDEAQTATLFNTLQTMLKPAPQPKLYTSTFSPFPLQTVSEQAQSFSTYNELLLHLQRHSLEQKAIPKEDPAIAKLRKIIEAQQQNLLDVQEESKKLQAQGEAIYHHYQYLHDLLEKVNDLRKAKKDEALKTLEAQDKRIKQLDIKNGKLKVDLS